MVIAFLRPRQTWMFFGYATRKAATQQFVPLPPQKNDFKGEIDLDIMRVATPDMRIPAAPILQRALLPSAANVIDAVSRLLAQSSK